MRVPKVWGAWIIGALLFCLPFDAAQARNSTWVDSGENIVYQRVPVHPLFRLNAAASQQEDNQDDFDDNWESLRVFPIMHANAGPLRVYVAENSRLYKSQYMGFVKDSMDQWSRALDGRMRYELVDSPSDAQITVSWVTGFEDADTAGLTTTRIGHADVRIKTPGIPENIIHGDIMHELGHALGIEGHSHANNDIMMSGRSWSSASEFHNYHPRLTSRDVQAIRRLYDSSWRRGEDLYQAAAQQPLPTRTASQPPQQPDPVQQLSPVNRSLLPLLSAFSRKATVQYHQPAAPIATMSNMQTTSEYMGDIQSQVKRYWRTTGRPQGAGVVVLFRLSREGNLLGYRLMRSSGEGSTDLAAMQALRQAAPFQPLPGDYSRDTMDVKLTLN